MYSEMIREVLAREVVGQPEAINGVARGVTRLVSGLTPSERSWCAYLFVGPPGTGRAHTVRSLARVLHGVEDVVTVDCRAAASLDPRAELQRQLAPLGAPVILPQAARPMATTAAGGDAWGPRPIRLAMVQNIEAGGKELYSLLAHLLESGRAILPGGEPLRLEGCMLFFTSSLCTDLILNESKLGFPGSAPDEREGPDGSLNEMCREEAQRTLGAELVNQFDNLIVFHRLQDEHLIGVLERYTTRMNRWLAQRGIQCELMRPAMDRILQVATRRGQAGAHDLVRIYRREVEFPIADLLVSGALPAGGRVQLDHREGEEHLHFSVQEHEWTRDAALGSAQEIPVSA